MTLPKVVLWSRLRRGGLQGFRFRRQHPIGPYVLDFYCSQARLALEVDGAAHDVADRAAADAVRTAWLAAQGVEVLRLPARDVRPAFGRRAGEEPSAYTHTLGSHSAICGNAIRISTAPI